MSRAAYVHFFNQTGDVVRRAASDQGRQVLTRRDALLPTATRRCLRAACRYYNLGTREIRGPLAFDCRQTLRSTAYARLCRLDESRRNKCRNGVLLGPPRVGVALLLLPSIVGNSQPKRLVVPGRAPIGWRPNLPPLRANRNPRGADASLAAAFSAVDRCTRF